MFRLVLVSFAIGTTAIGQQTIFNVPSADVLDRGKVYTELDVSFKTVCEPAVCKFSSLVPRVVIGAGRSVEVGLNVNGNIQPGPDATTLAPTVKWRFFQDQKKSLVIYAGTSFYIPIRNRAYNVGAYSYVALSKSISKTRVTAGGFFASKNVFAPHAVRGGGQFGFEHTVNKYLNINADYYTGRHASGYFTPGIAVKLHPKITIYAGYSIGNADAARGNHFFLVELGYNLN